MNIGKTIFNYLKKSYAEEGQKFRIAFCPYKADMWDSMDSVYRSAINDKETDTCIIPIPYFKLTQSLRVDSIEHDFNVLHKDNFPARLNEKWDCIVFHYPYDNRNNVTRPLVYSNELKHFCKKLVYIPYAVSGNNVIPEDMMNLPGLKNADVIIAENDIQKSAQEQVFSKYNVYPRPSVIALGNPKYDYVESFQPCVPESWKEKIAGRKVIFLQTGLVPMFCKVDKIQQIEQLFAEYKSQKDNFCIIWRHHPLFRNGIITHRPSELQRFDNLVRFAEESDYIIYDTTVNYATAMKICDKMYSDGSSIDLLAKHIGIEVNRF